MDSSYFGDFYAEMLPKVHRYIWARFPSPLAEDLANETMLTLWRKDLPTPGDDVARRQLRTMTYKIALGLVMNAQRRVAREEAVAGAPTMMIVGGDDPTYEAVVPARVTEAIADLAFADRQALNLLLAGFRTNEIADILDIEPKAASMRLSRAKTRLASALGATQEEVADDARA